MMARFFSDIINVWLAVEDIILANNENIAEYTGILPDLPVND